MTEFKNPIILFPLPSTVFYPSTLLPLHIFEARYRKMVEDSLNSHLLIGMVLLKPRWDKDYFGRPPVEQIGCAGKIDNMELLPDGKFNIVLKGLSRFRILKESKEKLYRLATVDFLESVNDLPLKADSSKAAHNLISKYEELINATPKKKGVGSKPCFKACETLGQAIDQIVYSLEWNINKKQAFLEERNVQNRLAKISSELDLRSQILRVSSALKKSETDSRLN